jgi:dienelactone hydrolase
MLTTGSVKLVPADLGLGKRMKSGTVTLTNTGGSPLRIDGITISATHPGAYSQANTCGASVAPGVSCSIGVIYNGINVSAAGVLIIADSSSDSPQQINLSTAGAHPVTAATRTALAAHAFVSTPPPSGDQEVGTRVLHLIDATHADPYVQSGMQREILVRFWYPTSHSGACTLAGYTSAQVWSYFATLVGAPLPQVTTHSCLNAPMAAGVHPIVVLSHGFTGTFTDYTFLTEDLASRGYVVASVDHTHEATAVEFPDGRLEKSVFGSHLTEYVRSDAGALGFALAVRLDDLGFVLDELKRLNASAQSDFGGRLDLTRVALAGHSLGGLTTLRALEREPRFKAGILLDPLMPPHEASPVYQSVLTLVAGRERWNEDDCRLWEALRGPRVAVNLPDVEHIGLSDAAWLLTGDVDTGAGGPDRAIAYIRKTIATFLDANLAGPSPHPTAIVASPDYPEASVATQGQSVCAQQ